MSSQHKGLIYKIKLMLSACGNHIACNKVVYSVHIKEKTLITPVT